MTSSTEPGSIGAVKKPSWRRLFRRFRKSRDGAAAIEFAILAIPYFMIVFAIIETFIAFWGEELVSNAVQTMGRQLRTGNITYNLGRSTDMDEAEFRAAFCDQISILITCSDTEINTPSKLYLDVREFDNFADIPADIPKVSTDDFAELDTSEISYNPGGPGTINMLRAYYKWQIITDLMRPLISTVRIPGDESSNYFLIVATTAFQNEDYP